MRTSLRTLLVSTIAIGAASAALAAHADNGDTLHWQSVIGVLQPNNVVGSGSGAVTAGGSPWSTLSGHANVDLARGEVQFEVQGLALAGGNSIGTPGPVAQVKGTLVCDTDGSASSGNSVLVDTELVNLDDQGNARFAGNVGVLPAACMNEPDIAFLIRVGAGRWIANGTILR
jgi:hypothetical protein